MGRTLEKHINHHYLNTEKTISHKKYSVPRGLQNFLAAVNSDIMDPKNRHKVSSNISMEEKEALQELIKLQKKRQIVI